MKKVLPIVFFLSTGIISAQIIPSSCTAVDSIVQKYRNDAYRLAVRHVHHINSTYKDSAIVNAGIRSTYQRALIAVYNATAIAARDTVVSFLNIHTRPDPELRSLHIKAPGALPWMDKLFNSITPTGDAQVDLLMNKYKLQPVGYAQSTNYDLAVLKSDSSLNLSVLVKAFKAIANVIDAEAPVIFNDVVEITDTVNTSFTGLTYSFGWGSCQDSCDMRAYWKFRVYNDCSVEYMGSSGDPLFLGLHSYFRDPAGINIYPNPAAEEIELGASVNYQNGKFQIINLQGQILQEGFIKDSGKISIKGLAPALYFVTFKNGTAVQTAKFIKQ